jgi:hypothetical protein
MQKGGEIMDKYAENVALLYLLKSKDISSLTLEQLYELYADTAKKANEYAKTRKSENKPTFSFD